MPQDGRKTKDIPEPRDMSIQDFKYQPPRSELCEEMDMPGLTRSRSNGRSPGRSGSFNRPRKGRSLESQTLNCDYSI